MAGTWRDVFPNTTCRWPKGTCKDAQHHSSNQNRNELSLHTCQNGYITKTADNKHWQGCGEKWTFVNCWWKCKLVQPLWKTVWRFLNKLKIELPYDPATTPLGIYPKETKTLWKDTCTLMFIGALFTIAKIWKQPKCPLIEEWI